MAQNTTFRNLYLFPSSGGRSNKDRVSSGQTQIDSVKLLNARVIISVTDLITEKWNPYAADIATGLAKACAPS